VELVATKYINFQQTPYTIIVNNNGNATVQGWIAVTSTIGCSKTQTVLVGIHPVPTLSVTTSGTICAGASATLTAGGANSYTWNTSAVSNSIVVNPSVTTVYSVTGVNAFGCTSTQTVTQQVDPCLGFSSIGNETQIIVYPNPANQALILEFSGYSDNDAVEVLNVLGQKLMEMNVRSNKIIIDVSEMQEGYYFLKLKSKSGSEERIPFIIRH
jgi:hypothetical protein